MSFRLPTRPDAASAANLRRTAREHLLLHFARNGGFGDGWDDLLVLERGEGPYVFDDRGRRYLDGLSSLFCCQIGYSYGERMAAAAAAQMTRLPFNTVWSTAHAPAIALAERLAELAPEGIEHVFFTNGGSESVEAAWKIARQYHSARGEPQRTKAIARRTAYHGVTLGALALTGVDRFKTLFGPPALEVTHVSNTGSLRRPEQGEELTRALLDELEVAVHAAGPDQVAMIIAEPVQNAGGSFVPPPGYWPGVRALADQYGILLICDEVITGFGRLGHWFGCQRYDVVPDLITCAKGMTSAYAPMGAVLASKRVAEPLFADDRMLLHGITFAGHPVAAAVALANLEIFEEDRVLDHVRATEPHLERQLRTLEQLPVVGEVRGAGFFWSLELVGDGGRELTAREKQLLVREVVPRSLLDAGLIARPDDRQDAVLQLAPPLISDEHVIDEMVDACRSVLEDAGDALAAASH